MTKLTCNPPKEAQDQCFLVGHFILVIVFICLTNICKHFYFILVVNVNFIVTVLVSVDENVILILVIVLFQISQLFNFHGHTS